MTSSSFVYVLGAGLAIFLVGGVLAGYVQETEPGAAGKGNVVFSEALGTVGGGAEAAPRQVVDLEDVTVQQQSPNSTEVSDAKVTVKSSVMGSTSDVIEFEAVQPRKAYISFVPTKAGNPSSLIIEVNGQPLDVPAFEEGERVTLVVENLKKGTNTVHFAAADPGMQFWKSNTYTLKSLDVVLEDLKNARVIKPFRVYPYEVDGFSHGEITYSISESTVKTSPLRIAINGNTVSTRSPIPRASAYTATFFANTTGLHAGENVFSMYTSGDATYPIDSVDVRLFFYAGTERTTVVRDFNLSSSQYNRLKPDTGGTISFYVERTLLQRPLTVSLTNQSYTVTPTSGTNTVTFGKNAVVKGDNTVKLSTDGAYRISGFNITIPKR